MAVHHTASNIAQAFPRATKRVTPTKAGLVTPEPKKRPKSSYIRFRAAMPNETWQSDFTHYPLLAQDSQMSQDTEILTWLDDCTRMALSVTAHTRVTGTIVRDTFVVARKTMGYRPPRSPTTAWSFPQALRAESCPAARFPGGKGGRNKFAAELVRLHIIQKNSRPNPHHPAHPGPQRPHRQRHHRRTPQRPKKSIRRKTISPANEEHPNLLPQVRVSGMS